MYHYDLAGKLIEETDGNGKLITDYMYLNGKPLAMITKQAKGEATFYYHNDHLGTPKVMTDVLQKIVWNVEFDPFGNEVTQNGRAGGYIRSVTNNFRFPGQYFDAETGLNYNYYRDYNPVIGRYLEVDPIGNQQGKNHLYVYVNNSPVRFADRLGLEKTCTCLATFSAIGPNQALNKKDALGISPPNDSVAISPEAFGLPYGTIAERVATQKEISDNIGNIQISAPDLSEYLTGGTIFTISDVGDPNIRNSSTVRFDIYRFETQRDAVCFGKHTVPVTITGVPDNWACPK